MSPRSFLKITWRLLRAFDPRDGEIYIYIYAISFNNETFIRVLNFVLTIRRISISLNVILRPIKKRTDTRGRSRLASLPLFPINVKILGVASCACSTFSKKKQTNGKKKEIRKLKIPYLRYLISSTISDASFFFLSLLQPTPPLRLLRSESTTITFFRLTKSLHPLPSHGLIDASFRHPLP